MDYQYSQLLSRNVSYPECLCEKGLPEELNDTCPNGLQRLRNLDADRLKLMAINDGSWDPTSSPGFTWPGPQTWLHLLLREPSIVRLFFLATYFVIPQYKNLH